MTAVLRGTQKTRDKAGRIWDEGRVCVDIAEPHGPSGGPTYLALVRGETNSYAVTCGPDGAWRCPCQSYVVCSHLMACWIGLDADPAEDPRGAAAWAAVWAPLVARRLAEDRPEIVAVFPEPDQED